MFLTHFRVRCSEASLLAEVLADAKSKGAKKVVLKEVSVDDVAAVSAAVELQFKIERKSENTFSMVADCTKQVKNLDAIVLTRKLGKSPAQLP